jgi:hypothetical protein
MINLSQNVTFYQWLEQERQQPYGQLSAMEDNSFCTAADFHVLILAALLSLWQDWP